MATGQLNKWMKPAAATPPPDKKVTTAATKPAAQPSTGSGTVTNTMVGNPIPSNLPAGGQSNVATGAAPTPGTAPAAVAPTPVRTELNPATDTVQGQVEGIINKDSPVMQLARTRASQVANNRGLLNSSMAVQAGEAAVIDAAMPMASQDAATFARNKELNTATENEFKMQDFRGQQSKELAEIENKNQRLLQTSQSASDLMARTNSAISEIMANPDIPAKQKSELINNQKLMLQNGLAVIGGITDMDLTSLLNFSKKGSGGKISGKDLAGKRPEAAKAGDIYTDENGKKWKFFTLKGGITKNGEWKPA